METNIYELEDWVVNLFKFLEVKGMMKNFRQEFKSWKSSFLKRLDKWLLPLLDSGVSLRRILMNKLSTKNNLKGAARKSLKGAAIKSYGVHEAFQGFKSNSESSPISAFNDLFKIGEELNNDFKIQNGDLNWLINSFSLRDLKAGIIIRRQWQKNGIQVRSPIRTFMGAMNKREKSISKDRSWKKKPQMSISESKQILSDKGSQTLVCLGSLLGI